VKISIAVHGRFHAFDLAAALLRNGQDVRLLTNARARAVARMFPLHRTSLLRRHFLLANAARTIAHGEPPPFFEARLKQMFGRWAARKHIARLPDVIHCWSGVAEETLRACGEHSICTVARGSAHIRTQHDLLEAEERRTGHVLEKPSRWIIEREEREYELAHAIIVPSSFAGKSFVERGVSSAKVRVVPLPLRATGFTAGPASIAARTHRLRSGAPLRVVYVGMLSYRKGMHDLLAVMRELRGVMEFRLVGPLLTECADFARMAARVARVEPAVPEARLPEVYSWGDVFVLPTIEDGFAVVLAQAQAAGLPIITTTNSGGPDILAHGGQGFVVPVRAPQAFVEQLRWCDANREQVAQMVERLHAEPPRRTWDDVANDFMQAVTA
jgi:glycosyltransferase involved in cell wall biosynthesis